MRNRPSATGADDGAAAVCFLGFGAATQSIDLGMNAEAWVATLAVTVLSTVVAIVAFLKGIQLVGAGTATIVDRAAAQLSCVPGKARTDSGRWPPFSACNEPVEQSPRLFSVLAESIARVEALPDDARVLDIGGWAAPLARADVVLDLLPYETRGLYGAPSDPERERFTSEMWVQHDICSREPFPFADDAFDLVVCSHTLEDVRDPVWVCSELSRIGRAGYVEVPSRLQEQSWGVNGDFVGWSHHRWLIDVVDGGLEFGLKPHSLHARRAYGWTFSADFAAKLSAAERVSTLWWEGTVPAREHIFVGVDEVITWLRVPVLEHGHRDPGARVGRGRALARRLRDRMGARL